MENEVSAAGMSGLESVLDQIRDKHFHRIDLHLFFGGDADNVTSAQVSLDVAEDTMAAISNYLSGGIGADVGERHLRLYGVLQAVVLQQKAIWTLCKLFLGPSWTKPGPSSAWEKVRTLRVVTVGHPIKRGGDDHIERSFLTQISLEDDGFDYEIWHKATSTFSFERAELVSLLMEYAGEAARNLERLLPVLTAAVD
jgi:hypothetical protein